MMPAITLAAVVLVDCQAGDLLGSPSYFRATFEPFVPAVLADSQRIAADVYDSLRGGDFPYLTPVNMSELLPGQSVFVFDVRIFPSGAQLTVAELARDLNGARISAVLRKLQRISLPTSQDESSRADDQAAEQDQSDADSLLHKIALAAEKIGLFLLVLVLIGAALALTYVYRTYVR